MQRRLLGVLNGRDMPSEMVAKWALSADVLWAADGGADRLAEAGFSSAIIVGDLDSVSSEVLHGGAKVLQDSSQDATDCDKLLALAFLEGFSSITLASVEGDRPDHFLATLHSASKASIRARLAMRRGIGWILRPGDDISIPTQPGRRLSLLPVSEVRGVHLRGVAWSLDGATLHPNGFTSVSNRSTTSTVIARVDSGSAFMFVEYPPEEMPFW